jgi:hypothetical protein
MKRSDLITMARQHGVWHMIAIVLGQAIHSPSEVMEALRKK